MSFDYDQREVFNHIHLAREENVDIEYQPKWGYICDSCGRDSRSTYNGRTAILSYDLQDIVNAWFDHLTNSHGISYPKPLCDFTIHGEYMVAPLHCIAGEKGHEGKHKFEF